MNYYRIIDADYALVGLQADMPPVAYSVADTLRRDGLRVGAIVLGQDEPMSRQVANLLSQVLAVAILELKATHRRMGTELTGILREATREPDWPFPDRVSGIPNRLPRVYSAVLSPNIGLSEPHLISLVKAMRCYGPNCFCLDSAGAAVTLENPKEAVLDCELLLENRDGSKPAGRGTSPRTFAEVVRSGESQRYARNRH